MQLWQDHVALWQRSMQRLMGEETPPLIEPEKGDVEGGTYVRIKGNRFIADGARNAKVYFGPRQGSVIRFASDSELIVEAPGGQLGEKVDVLIIFEPSGELKIAKGFEYIEKNDGPLNPDDLAVPKDTKK